MLTSVFHTETFSLYSVALTMAVALLSGLVIAFIYKKCNVTTGKFSIILVMVPLLISTVILIADGNLGASIAVLGAFSLVRFRSVAGGAAEIGFIFFAMTVGLATGMGYLTFALLITAAGGIAFFLLDKMGFAEPINCDRSLKITIPESLNYTGLFDNLFKAYTSYAHLENVRTTGMGTLYELHYNLRLRNDSMEKDFLDDLRCLNGNLDIVIGAPGKEATVL